MLKKGLASHTNFFPRTVKDLQISKVLTAAKNVETERPGMECLQLNG